MDPAALQETVALVRRLGDEARERQCEGVFELKADRTYVTAIDFSLETRIKAFLKERFPGHRVLGEEKGFSGGEQSRWTWVLDPIDGTSNFAMGLPYWAVSLALLDGMTPCWGCVYIPAQKELYLGARGGGATLNDRPIRVSDHGDMRPEDLFGVDTRSLIRFDFAFPQDARAVGAASLSIVFTACGRYVGFFLAHWHIWDIAARHAHRPGSRGEGDLSFRRAPGCVRHRRFPGWRPPPVCRPPASGTASRRDPAQTGARRGIDRRLSPGPGALPGNPTRRGRPADLSSPFRRPFKAVVCPCGTFRPPSGPARIRLFPILAACRMSGAAAAGSPEIGEAFA